MNINIRPVNNEDVSDILAIYTPYITDTVITFETEVPTLEEFTDRVERIRKEYPYIVCEADGRVVGYAYASKHHERAAYKYSVDVSIYVAHEYHHKGIGSKLYSSLFEALNEYDYYTAYAGITLPNEKSVGIHKSFGFTEIGIFHKAGYKLDKWHDVLYMEKPLKDYDMISDRLR